MYTKPDDSTFRTIAKDHYAVSAEYIDSLEPNQRSEVQKILDAVDLINGFIALRGETQSDRTETRGYLDPVSGNLSVKTIDKITGEEIESLS